MYIYLFNSISFHACLIKSAENNKFEGKYLMFMFICKQKQLFFLCVSRLLKSVNDFNLSRLFNCCSPVFIKFQKVFMILKFVMWVCLKLDYKHMYFKITLYFPRIIL